MKKIIKLSEPNIFGNEIKSVKKCFSDKWISAGGNYNLKFENSIKKITKSRYAISCINCSAALQLSVRIINPNYGDEILVPSITFISTINAIINNNCNPVFIDCGEDYLIDVKQLTHFLKKQTIMKKGFCLNKKTRKRIIAVIVVHTFGNVVDLNKNFLELCKKKNIKIIEDAAESLGSYYKINNSLKHSGVIGDIGCLSFNGNKIITSGGGGMIITNKKHYAEKAKYLSNQAKNDSTYFIHDDVGYNYRMSNLHAAVGISQFKKLGKVIIKKKKINSLYSKHLNKLKGLKILKSPKNSKSNYWLSILKIDKGSKTFSVKKNLIKFLEKKGIETRSVWYPNHLQKPFKRYQNTNLNNSMKVFNEGLCLPSSFNLSKKEQSFVIKIIINFFKKNKNNV